MSFPKPVFFILGPTASGKSHLAAAIAKITRAEIIGADAYQVYRGLDLLTAKPPREILTSIPHHLIDEIPLDQSFDVSQYNLLARQRIREVQSRNHPVLIVGGTGLYARALSHGLADLPKADLELRAELEPLPAAELLARLELLDPDSAASIDAKNPRRLIRALEVCILTGKPFSSFRQQWGTTPANVRGVILEVERARLYQRIDERSRQMFARGVVQEVAQAGPTSSTAGQAIGYKSIQSLLAGTMSEAACVESIQKETRAYAKRQSTWFRRETHLETFDATNFETPEEINRAARVFVERLGMD